MSDVDRDPLNEALAPSSHTHRDRSFEAGQTTASPLGGRGAAVSAAQGPGGWVGIVANRGSGLGRGRRLVEQLVAQLRRQGLRSEVAWSPEERVALVARASRDDSCRCLAAVGGDGTVAALLNERPARPVTVLPAGTENLVARHFGLRGDARGAARTIAAGRALTIDVGQAGGRRFLLMAGFGFDADVVRRHHRARTSRSGRARPTHRMAYVEPILRSSLSYRFPTISARISGPDAEEELQGTTMMVFNLPRYALGLPFAPDARADDGWLDLVVFQRPGPWHALNYLWKVVCRSHLGAPGVFHRRARAITVTADERIPVQLDGDPFGDARPDAPDLSAPREAAPARQGPAEWAVEILPGALSVLAPPERAPRPPRARSPG